MGNSKMVIIIIITIAVLIGGGVWFSIKEKNESIRNQCRLTSVSTYGSEGNKNDDSIEAVMKRGTLMMKTYDDCLHSQGLNK